MSWADVSRISYQEKMLWACVLRRSVFDYVLYKGQGKHKRKWQRASQFLFGGGDPEEFGLSFEQICGLFGWEPDYLRRLAKELTRGDIKKLEAAKFKEQFDEEPPAYLSCSHKWRGVDAAAPFLQPYNYSRVYREYLRPRVVIRERVAVRQMSFLPTRRWANAA